MTKLTLEQQELLFANDCKLINLRYEYHGYTGTEKWAIVTELAEEELWVKYPDVIRRYTPFILLSMAQGEVIMILSILLDTFFSNNLWFLRWNIMGWSVAKSHYIPAHRLAPIVTLF